MKAIETIMAGGSACELIFNTRYLEFVSRGLIGK